MLGLAQKDPNGFIELTAVMAFKRMRRLTQFPLFVAEVVRSSAVVEVSPDGTKLRRIAPIPKNLEEALTRTVLVEKIKQMDDEASLLQLFEPLGNVERIRVLRRADSYPGGRVVDPMVTHDDCFPSHR